MTTSPKRKKKVVSEKTEGRVTFYPAGRVDLNMLTSADWKEELARFLSIYGHLDHKDLKTCIPAHTERHRQRVLFAVIGELVHGKGIRQLSMVKPRHLDWLADKWHADGVSVSHQLNNYAHLKWFWKVCSIKAPPYPCKVWHPGMVNDKKLAR